MNLTQAALAQAVGSVLAALGWKSQHISPALFVARIPVSMCSWGEKLIVLIAADGTVTARSQGMLPTQCIDWGKNRRNITTFFNQLACTLPSGISLSECEPLIPHFDERGRTPIERVFGEDEEED